MFGLILFCTVLASAQTEPESEPPRNSSSRDGKGNAFHIPIMNLINVITNGHPVNAFTFGYSVYVSTYWQPATCIFLIFYNEPELGARINPGMLWHGFEFQPFPYFRS